MREPARMATESGCFSTGLLGLLGRRASGRSRAEPRSGQVWTQPHPVKAGSVHEEPPNAHLSVRGRIARHGRCDCKLSPHGRQEVRQQPRLLSSEITKGASRLIEEARLHPCGSLIDQRPFRITERCHRRPDRRREPISHLPVDGFYVERRHNRDGCAGVSVSKRSVELIGHRCARWELRRPHQLLASA
jgi:hypothetical protein